MILFAKHVTIMSNFFSPRKFELTMSNNLQLEHLNLTELNILLGHLRLGEAHLKKQLNNEQYKSLLQLGSLNFDQKNKITSNKAEKSGQVALVLNTVITSVFGAWMGFSAFMGLKLDSPGELLCITLLALSISLIVGYYSFKLTAQNARTAIRKQKLLNVQAKILKLMIFKQEEFLTSNIKYLNHSLAYVESKSGQANEIAKHPVYDFENQESFGQWRDKLVNAIKIKTEGITKRTIYQFYSDRLHKITELLSKKLNNDLFLNSEIFLNKTHSQLSIQTDNEKNSFIHILAKPQSSSFVMPRQKTWFRDNFRSLIAGIVPTLLGGFASMFVFLAGGPNLARELGLMILEQRLRHPHSRLVEFSVALMLTLYYGISFVYNNYKNYLREHESDKTVRELVELDKRNVYLKRKLKILAEIKIDCRRIINIYTAIENIENHLVEQKEVKERV